ncbi:histidine kinase 5 isoform X2 [Selaginella moellendorffii]|uniref:histidine kinase 5 isoform X2 n=1 Tax=Selaginella moellendorffii TaxID=88036 RepID=UPI000D1D11DD|nr:histidine kinase 5 isoform X2 [Selaginella moellendorffii]|eukprot:XP_024533072.1 histidine kinase 5 isoform X2 [Selaginella moellendorffii]
MKGKRLAGIDMDMDAVLSSLIEENKVLRARIKRLLQSAEENLTQTLDGSLLKVLADNALEVPEVVKVFETALTLLLEGMPFGLSYWDEKLSCTYTKVYDGGVNDSILKEIIGQQDADFLPEVIHLLEMKDQIIRGGAAQRREFKVERPGATRTFCVVCEPVQRKEKLQGVVTILVDKTSQEAMRRELTQMKAETEQWERTEQGLRQAIKSADEAMEAKNTFLAVMSHEIRTPLNGVLGMAQVLATTSLDSEQKELVDAMVFSGDVLLAIISDILDLSKVEAGTMKLEEREFNPRIIVKHVARTATAATKDRGIKIEVDISDDVPATVIGDPLRLKQVITNLVFNAVKFTKEGHVRVHLKVLKDSHHAESERCGKMSERTSKKPQRFDLVKGTSARWDVLPESGRKDMSRLDNASENQSANNQDQKLYLRAKILEAIPEDEQEYRIQEPLHFLQDKDRQASDMNEDHNFILLEFAVEDTGIGIPEEAFPSLFEKFTQVHSSTTRKYGGTGLGLAICKQLVELMGGQIFVSSRVGEGSTFSFTLRCKCAGDTQRPDRHASPTNLESNLSYTTAHFHKLQAGLSCTSSSAPAPQSQGSLVTTASCPLASKAVDDNGRRAFLQGNSSSSKTTREVVLQPKHGGRLRRTSSGPPRIECSLMADVENSKKAQMVLSSPGWQPRLLLAEDNKVNVLVALSMLKRLGLTADVAFNGQEAISAIQARSYDLVFMDVCMPVLDGLEVTRRVRLYERTGRWESEDSSQSDAPKEQNEPEQQQQQQTLSRRLPIVAMTANALSGCEEQCVEYGMDSFVTKPITFRKLQNVLQVFLARRGQQSSP